MIMMLKKHLHVNHYGDYVVYDAHNLLVHIRLKYLTNIKLNNDHTTAYTNDAWTDFCSIFWQTMQSTSSTWAMNTYIDGRIQQSAVCVLWRHVLPNMSQKLPNPTVKSNNPTDHVELLKLERCLLSTLAWANFSTETYYSDDEFVSLT